MSSSPLPVATHALVNPFLLPISPVLSSQKAGWDRLNLGLFCQPPYRVPEHTSDYHTLCINVGTPVNVELIVDGKSTIRKSVPSDISIFPAKLWQAFEWHKDVAFLDLFVAPSLVTQAGLELFETDRIELVPHLQSSLDPLIYQIGIALRTALETDGLATKLYADVMANALAVHLVSHYSNRKLKVKSYSGGLSQQKLQHVTAYIYDHLDQELRLADLASLVQLSPYHFARLFKQSTGLAPHQYHLKCRVDRAKQLLFTRDLNIAEVASAVGFASQSHFNYHFKRMVGVSPKKFLQQQ
jgi:AraC family transcriptional regulator